MEGILLSIALGLGLSAACGFRIFVPMLVVSIAARSGHLTLSEGWLWLASTPALVAFSTATVLEIVAYYIPLVDHFLDMVAAPVAAVAGAVVAAAVFVEISPLLKWTLAIVAGGGAASVVHVGKTVARAGISIPTFGMGNWLVSTGEIISAFGVSVLSLLMPILGFIFFLGLAVLAFVIYRRRRLRKRALLPA
jgi:hypothetical protein